MKILIPIIASVLLFSSCERGWNDTTFSVTNNISPFEHEIEEYNGTLYSVVVYCFEEDNVVDEISLGNIAGGGGTSEVIEVDKNITKIKVSYRFLPGSDIFQDRYYNFRYYNVTYYYMEKRKHHDIAIEWYTMVSNKLNIESGDRQAPLSEFYLLGEISE